MAAAPLSLAVPRIIVVSGLSPVNLPVVDVTIVLVAVMTLNVTVVTVSTVTTAPPIIMVMRHPDLGRRCLLRINHFKVNFPQVLVNPLQPHLDWLANLENPVGLTTNQGHVLFGVLVVVIIHHADVD